MRRENIYLIIFNYFLREILRVAVPRIASPMTHSALTGFF